MKKRNMLLFVSVMLIAGQLCSCAGSGKAELLTPSEKSGQETEVLSEEEDMEAEKGQEEMSEQINMDGSLWSFSHRLLQENLEEVNPVLSPVSAYLALGMTGLGAKGETLEAFEEVMGTKMQDIAEACIQNLPKGTMPNGKVSGEEERETVLSLANSVWIDHILTPNDSWITDVSEKYGAEAYRAKLSDKGTMKQMNGWIKHKTNGMIEKFLSEPLEPDTCLALFNTLYFYGQWRSEFSARATEKEAFTTEDGTKQQVDMMRKNRTHLFYVKGADWDGAVLPYRDGTTAFVALKPTNGQRVRDMYAQLTEEDFVSAIQVDSTTYANLKLPKFQVSFDRVLNEALQNMGLACAFDPVMADFSGIGTSEMGNIYISLVRQKAMIAVDEKGTEAAAVTMVTQKATSAAPPKEEPIDVFFDRPFLYMIVDLEQQVPVFMGIMDYPK